MKKDQKEFENAIKNPFFLSMIGVDYKDNKKAFFFYSIKRFKLMSLGVASYILYYYPIAQISVIAGIEGLYFGGLVLVRPFLSYFKMLVEALQDCVLFVLLFLVFLMLPDLDLMNFTVFNNTGIFITIVMFVALMLVGCTVIIKLCISIREIYQEWKKNRKPSEKKPTPAPQPVKPIYIENTSPTKS